jgi:hypothetical protein
MISSPHEDEANMRQPVERIQQILNVTDPDGSTRIIEGTTLVPSTDTPEFGVTERLVSVPGTGPRQTVTASAPKATAIVELDAVSKWW